MENMAKNTLKNKAFKCNFSPWTENTVIKLVVLYEISLFSGEQLVSLAYLRCKVNKESKPYTAEKVVILPIKCPFFGFLSVFLRFLYTWQRNIDFIAGIPLFSLEIGLKSAKKKVERKSMTNYPKFTRYFIYCALAFFALKT